MAMEKVLNPLVKTRKILLAATKAYIRAQRRVSFKDHTREEITAAWVEADNILLARAKALKAGP